MDVADTGLVLGPEFTRTLRDAQAGNEDAFVRLWRDATPVMIRYLRVVGHDDPYDAACEGWVTVVRGLPGFTGDEVAWHVWLLACTRLRAEEGNLRQAWDAVTVLPGLHVDDDLDIDDLLEPEDGVDPARRGINDSVRALRALPLGQGEVLMLRLGAGLPASAVSDIIGVDVDNVRRAEVRGLQRLGTDAELLSWSLSAPASFYEYADEAIALAAFRAIPARSRHPERVRVIAIGAATGRAALAAGQRSSKTMARSRTAVLAVTALSASAVSLGGLSAAAYVGVLPQPVQQAMHDAIGAPAPDPDPSAETKTPSAQATRAVRLLTPSATSRAVDLCRAWATDRVKGVTGDRSAAFRSLSRAAGGSGAVDPYCALLVPVPGTATTPVGLPTPPTTWPTTTTAQPVPTTPVTSDAPTEGPSTSTTPPTPSDTPSDPPTTPPETTTTPDPGLDTGSGSDPGPGSDTTGSDVQPKSSGVSPVPADNPASTDGQPLAQLSADDGGPAAAPDTAASDGSASGAGAPDTSAQDAATP